MVAEIAFLIRQANNQIPPEAQAGQRDGIIMLTDESQMFANCTQVCCESIPESTEVELKRCQMCVVMRHFI